MLQSLSYSIAFSQTLTAWILEKEWPYAGFGIILMVMMVLSFVPTAGAALTKAGSRKNLVAELLWGDRR